MAIRLDLAGVDELHAALQRRDLSASELVEESLRRIDALDGELRSFILVDAEGARLAARAADNTPSEEAQERPLLGVPVAIKDNLDVAGISTTSGSPTLAFTATDDAESVRRLRAAGAIVVGKTNMHEAAYGATTLNPFYGACCNPWDTERIAGGSSGGSAAAVAAGLVPISLGSDTGGSIRIPAALTGTSGLRPSAGRVDARGLARISWTFDVIGPIARRASDIALVLGILAGDSTGTAAAPRKVSLGDVRLQVVEGAFDDASASVAAAVEHAIELLVRLGAQRQDVAIPGLGDWSESMTAMVQAEAYGIHRERLDRQPDAFSADVRARLELGAAISGADYARHRQLVREFTSAAGKLLEGGSVAVMPTTAIGAPLRDGAELLGTTRRLTKLTYPWSVVGVAALSIPCGFDADALPVGLQLVAAHGDDERALAVADAFQRHSDWHLRLPPICSSPVPAAAQA